MSSQWLALLSKRKNRTIIKRARSMAATSNCPGFLWTELVNIANLLINLSPTCANYRVKPKEWYTRIKPRVYFLKILAPLAYLHVPKEQRTELESKTIRCFFLGYNTESKLYKVFDPAHRKIRLSRDVVFDETKVGYGHAHTKHSTPSKTFVFPKPHRRSNLLNRQRPATHS